MRDQRLAELWRDSYWAMFGANTVPPGHPAWQEARRAAWYAQERLFAAIEAELVEELLDEFRER